MFCIILRAQGEPTSVVVGTQVMSTGSKCPRPYLGLAGGKLGFSEFHVKVRSKASPTVTTERNGIQVARI